MKMKFAGMGIAVLVLAAATAFAWGPGPEMRERFSPPWDDAKFAAKLGLTEDQVTALTAEQDTFREQMESIRTEMDQLHKAQRKLVEADTLDEAALRANTERMAALHADMMEAHTEHLIAMRTILTVEQFSKLQEMRPDKGFGRKMHSHRGDAEFERGPAPDTE